MEKLNKSTEGVLLIDSDSSPLTEDSLSLAEKGIYSYDVSIDEEHKGEYIQIAAPKVPLQAEQLPDEIRKILMDHKISANAAADKYLRVEHAY